MTRFGSAFIQLPAADSRRVDTVPHADALAVGERVRLWGDMLRDVDAGTLRKRYEAGYRHPYRHEPAPRRDLLPRESFLTTTSLIASRGCHNRCDFCYLSTEDYHVPYQMREVEQVVDEFRADGRPYAVFVDKQLGSRPDYVFKKSSSPGR